MGALQSFENQVVFYEPIPEWVTGMAIVQFAEVIRAKATSNRRNDEYLNNTKIIL